MNIKKILQYSPRYIAAIILLQTLLFKFGIGGDEFLIESKKLFSTITLALFGSEGFEAPFRIGTGVLELFASILILIPTTAAFGGVLGIVLMLGAILSHLLFIGISVGGDGGQLMIMALVVMICCIKTVLDEKQQLLGLLQRPS